ncbi:MAG: DUF928 domain-containing protein, partial [Leptolyngbya sp. SIO1D8]|nr:DUF928 domain-containing protein [Leptolyngbya sp. SIO1D8]
YWPVSRYGQYYYWYFKVYCITENGGQIEQVMEGWIRRITEATAPPNPALYYDDLADAALGQLNADGSVSDSWQNLLQELGWEAYSEVPIVEEIQLWE